MPHSSYKITVCCRYTLLSCCHNAHMSAHTRSTAWCVHGTARIYENIKNGDKEAVCAMVGQHIDNQKIAILAAIRENEKKKTEKA